MEKQKILTSITDSSSLQISILNHGFFWDEKPTSQSSVSYTYKPKYYGKVKYYGKSIMVFLLVFIAIYLH